MYLHTYVYIYIYIYTYTCMFICIWHLHILYYCLPGELLRKAAVSFFAFSRSADLPFCRNLIIVGWNRTSQSLFDLFAFCLFADLHWGYVFNIASVPMFNIDYVLPFWSFRVLPFCRFTLLCLVEGFRFYVLRLPVYRFDKVLPLRKHVNGLALRVSCFTVLTFHGSIGRFGKAVSRFGGAPRKLEPPTLLRKAQRSRRVAKANKHLSGIAPFMFYTRSPLQDSRLFGPSPWKILPHYLWKRHIWATQPLAKIF